MKTKLQLEYRLNHIIQIVLDTEETFIREGEPSHQGLLEAKAEAYTKIRELIGRD